MKILFISPLPPPIDGQSLASKVFLEEIKKDNDVKVVDMAKKYSNNNILKLFRIIEVIKIIYKTYNKVNNVDIIYLQISESFSGNIKDLIIYFICFKKLSKMYIHLHGGSIKYLLFDKYKVLFSINKYFISRLAGVIVSGKSHLNIFSDCVDLSKIHIVPNFAEDHLFLNKTEIIEKFKDKYPIKILYMSNLSNNKGYLELLRAFLSLDNDFKSKIEIDFAGRFESDSSRMLFLDKIKDFSEISYHGIVNNIKKKDLFKKAHVFCLPTSFLEGQPISILEAYASGCVVITTNKGGIRDIFENESNGFQVQEKSSDSIKNIIEKMIRSPEELRPIGEYNSKIAQEKFRTSIYNESLKKIIGI